MLRPRVGQKKPPRLGSTSCYGQTWARKSRQDSAVRFVTAKSWPERATETRQYDLLRPNVGQIVTAKSWPEKATKTRQYDLLRPRIGQKKPPRLGSTISYGQTWARKSHQDSAVRFVTAKSWPEKATKTRQYDLLRPRVGQKQPPRLGSTTCYSQTWVRKSHQDSAVRFVTARKSHQDSAVRFVTAKSWPERATETRQYDLLRPRVRQKEPPRDLLRPGVGKKEPPRLGSTICCGQEFGHKKSHQDSAVRFVSAKSWPERATKTRQYDLLRPNVCQKSHQDSAIRVVTAKNWPERATKTRQSYLLRRRVNQKEPPRPASTIRYGQKWARKNHQDSAVRFVTAKRGPRVGQNDSAVRFVTAKSGPERTNKTRQYHVLQPRVRQKEPPRLGSTICCGQEWARKSHQDPAGSTFCYSQEWARKSRQDSAIRFVTAKSGKKEPPRLGNTLCYGQNWARKNHQDPEVRLVMAKTVCYGQEWARESHQDSTVGFNMVKSRPERTAKTRQYDSLRPRVGQTEPPRLGSTTKNHQDPALQFATAKNRLVTWARKSFQDQAVRFITTRSGPERDTKTRQEDSLRPRVTRKSNQYPEIRFGMA